MRQEAMDLKKRKAAALEADKEEKADKSANDAMSWKKVKKGKWLDTPQNILVPYKSMRDVLENSVSKKQHLHCELDSHVDTYLAGSNSIAY